MHPPPPNTNLLTKLFHVCLTTMSTLFSSFISSMRIRADSLSSQSADPPPPGHPPLPPRPRRQVEIIERVKWPHLLPTGIGERYSQTILDLCQAALLRRCELPYKPKYIELSQGPLDQSLL
jgi:hypothetical protein